MKKERTFNINEEFLKSLKLNARTTRVKTGVSIPDAALLTVQAQLINETNEAIDKTNEAIDKTNEKLDLLNEKFDKLIELLSQTKTATTKAATTAK